MTALAGIVNTTLSKPQQVWNGGSGVEPYIFNNDTVNNLYIGDQQAVLKQDTTSCIPVFPLGGQKWPDVDIYAFAPIAVNLLIMPGVDSFAPSPVQVQLALNAAGLAKDTTVQAVNSSVNNPSFGPAKDSSVAQVNTTLGVPAQTTDITGVKNAVNNPSFGPAKDTTVSQVNTTLGTPAQTADVTGVKNAVNAPSFGPAKDVSVTALTNGGITIANDVAATGVPLLSKSNRLFNHTSGSFGAGATFQPSGNPFSVDQIGYEFAVTCQANAASTLPFFTVLIQFSDSTSGLSFPGIEFNFIMGASTPQQFCITGPTAGDTVSISITNQDTKAATMAATMALNSRVYTRHEGQQLTTAAAPGFTNGSYDVTGGILLHTNPSVGASGGTAIRICAFWGGKANLYFAPTGAQPGSVTLTQVGSPMGNSIVYGSGSIASGSVLNQEVSLPRSQCQLTITNSGGSAANFEADLYIAEFPP